MRAIIKMCFILLTFCSGVLAAEPEEKPINTVADLLKVRQFHDATTWSKEVLAQKYETVFVQLWDNLLRQRDKLQVLRDFKFKELVLNADAKDAELDWGIIRRKFAGKQQTLTHAQVVDLIDSLEASGYRLVESEWHHSSFVAATQTSRASSTVSILLHALNEQQNERVIARGNLKITWAAGGPIIASIDATDITLLVRVGEPAFKRKDVKSFVLDKSGLKNTSLHPVMVHDLNHDGLSEVIIGGFNEVYVNNGNWDFEKKPLCVHPVSHIRAAAIADLTGDGIDDYLAFPAKRAPVLYRGDATEGFPDKPVGIGIVQKFEKPSCVTVGDVDGDGDLDVFIGQQKGSYQSGFIPTPYYDANDGYPFCLMLNDGQGRFTDVTESAGLGSRRNRHVFSSTFVDFDSDGDQDLLLTNDFCGCDYYINDGKGNFVNATDTLKPTAHAFGMSHSFGDYNLDGRLDFITIGMSSTTARRLEDMGLKRKGFEEYDAKRPEMGYGNRLFLNRGDHFEQAPFNSSCARTGWSWGSTTLDFDSDGDQDIYVVNGQTSGATTRDYCTRFWCHDLYYKPGERPDGPVSEFFGKFAPKLFSGNSISWNGYEHNALLMNIGGQDGFVNVGYLMGAAYEFDSRVALHNDFDLDGKVDLLVEHKDVRNQRRHLYLLQNNWQSDNHWVGVHLRGNDKEPTHGAKLTLTLSNGRKLVQHRLTGHSVWSQHADTIHFGTGQATPTKLTVEWRRSPMPRWSRSQALVSARVVRLC